MNKKTIDKYVPDSEGFCHINCLLLEPSSALGATPMKRRTITELQQLCEVVWKLQERLGEDNIMLECSTGLVEEYRDDWPNANMTVMWDILIRKELLSKTYDELILLLPFLIRYTPTTGEEL